MLEKISQLIQQATEKIRSVTDLSAINDLKVQYLGKSGEVTSLLKGMKDIPSEERPQVGKDVNTARDTITDMIQAKLDELQQKALDAKMMKEQIDVTYDEKDLNRGSLHPCTLVIDEVLDIFTGMGFTVGNGPEIELDKFNFQLLNIPKDHPSRDMQDTLPGHTILIGGSVFIIVLA